MAEEFKVIETQEDFDAAIKHRLEKQRRSLEENFKSYSSPEDVANLTKELNDKIEGLSADLAAANEKITAFDAEKAELNSKINDFTIKAAKIKIANESGLPYDAVAFLQGANEDEIRESAEAFKKITGNFVPPMQSKEPAGKDGKEAYRSLARNLKK